MKYVRLSLNLAFGIIFLLIGLYSFSEFPIGGLLLVLISSLLLPPVRNFVYSRTNKELSLKVRGLAILLLLVASFVSVVESQVRKGRELAAMEAQERIQEEFTLSQKRHSKFFIVDSWNHAEYIDDSGAGLCVICHSLEVGGQRLVGPRCLSCHGDIQAFEVSIGEGQVGKGREQLVEVRDSAIKEYVRRQKRHYEFFRADTWDHANYVEDNGVGLCVICHSLEAGGPNMSGRGQRCVSCHRDIKAFSDSIQRCPQAGTTSP